MRFVILILLVLSTAACNNEGSQYPLCDLDPASPNDEVAACGGDDSPTATCVVEDQIQCDSMACGRYMGSDEFCTNACETARDCDRDGDVCIAWGDLGKYCTPE